MPFAGGGLAQTAHKKVSRYTTLTLRFAAIPLKLSEAEFSEYHQPNAAARAV